MVMRGLFVVHRYLGIAVGALMVMWCASGVVMMYVGYPALSPKIRVQNLAPIEWQACCKFSDALLADSTPIENAQVSMLAGRPVLLLGDKTHSRVLDLISGIPIERVSAQQAAAVAAYYSSGTRPARPQFALIDYDQWTVAGEFDADRPLYRFALNDAAGTELYVSSATGQAVQITTARQRFWNWIGAVPHWLYFTELRRKAWLWSQVVIYTALLGCFLTGIGIFIGVRQLAAQPAGRWSPYRGFHWWHHLAGLLFGMFTLTWVMSGLLSMNPWGWLEGGSARPERAQLRGSPPAGPQLKAALTALMNAAPADEVTLDLAPFNGQLFFIATGADGVRRRLNALALPTPLNSADLAQVSSVLSGGAAADLPELLSQEDAYYFSHHSDRVQLPVYRLTPAGKPGVNYYVDPVSAGLLGKIDGGAKGYRWWHQGLHRMDFTAALRHRPQWDALMLLLMSGVTGVCVTGACLGYVAAARSSR